MEINWTVVGWIIDMILNGFVWLIIAVLGLLLTDITDKWIRRALKFMDKADKTIRKAKAINVENNPNFNEKTKSIIDSFFTD